MSGSRQPIVAAPIEWALLLEAEQKQRSLAAPDDRESVRAWWRAMHDALAFYSAQVNAGAPPDPPPGQIIHILTTFAGDLAEGTIPDPIRDAAAEGNRPPGPYERRDILFAVAYRRAASAEGLQHQGEVVRIADRSPMKTLSAWYGVGAGALRAWVSSNSDTSGLGPLDADALRSLTKSAGARYRQMGRGALAIRGRRATR